MIVPEACRCCGQPVAATRSGAYVLVRRSLKYLSRAPVSTERRRDSYPRNIHVAAAAAPRPVRGISTQRKYVGPDVVGFELGIGEGAGES